MNTFNIYASLNAQPTYNPMLRHLLIPYHEDTFQGPTVLQLKYSLPSHLNKQTMSLPTLHSTPFPPSSTELDS